MVVYLKKPPSFTLQWHITERCNWHCKHCYQFDEDNKEELSTKQLFQVLEQYVFLIRKWGIPKNSARLNITGGEPFVREDFFELLERIGSYSNLFKWGLLSNGSFMTEEIAKKLKSLNLFRCQVSLEGCEKVNDEIRGEGSFKKVIDAIKILVKEGITTSVSVSLAKHNMNDIPKLVEVLYNSGASYISTRRIIPYGRGFEFRNSLLKPVELKNYYLFTQEKNKELNKKGIRFRIGIGCESGIFNDERFSPSHKNHCGIVNGRVLIVMANGEVLACRRVPIVMGNVLDQSLFEIWYSSNKLWEMRNLNNAHVFCQKCPNFNGCFGGAKCVTYTYSNELFVPDVQCWKFYKNLENPEFYHKLKPDLSRELKMTNCG